MDVTMKGNNTKTLTKVAVSYHPPKFKFEYTKGNVKDKYHKSINLTNFIQCKSRCLTADWTSRSTEIKAESHEIAVQLIERYSELLQIPSSKIERLIDKLLAANPTFSDKPARTSRTESFPDGLMQEINMSISKGSLAVSPLQEQPKFQRPTLQHELSTNIDSPDADSRSITKNNASHPESPSCVLSFEEREKLRMFGDLNQASDEDLAAAKDEMNKLFEKSQVLPSDIEYVYDKRIDFEEPDEESSWD